MRPITYVATGRVPAAMEHVFHALTDPTQVPAWLPGCQAAVTDGPVQKGSRVRAHFGKRVTVCEVWAPRSFSAWLLARLMPRRNSQLYVEQIFERLQRRFP